MARYQETMPRKDTAQRRPLTMDDLDFLKGLQTELNTQDTMGNADPRFWVIRQSVDVACDPSEADDIRVVRTDDYATVADSLDGFVEYLREHLPDNVTAKRNSGVDGWDVIVQNDFPLDDPEQDDYVTGLDELIDLLERAGIRDYALAYTRKEQVNVPDTLFLTHRECESHLRRYGYNYAPDAHAYAMTAVRSPQFERLVMLLQHADWGALPQAAPEKEARHD